MNPVFLALLCAALASLLFLVLCRSSPDELERSGDILPGAEGMVRLPRRYLLDQCLSPEDLEFVRSRRSPALLRLFLRERRRLAVVWLRQTGREARRLVRLHVQSVRYAADLRPAAEARLFLAVGLFLLLYVTMLAVVSSYGPLRTRRSLQSIQGLAGILAQLGDRIAASVVAASLPGAQAAAGAIR